MNQRRRWGAFSVSGIDRSVRANRLRRRLQVIKRRPVAELR